MTREEIVRVAGDLNHDLRYSRGGGSRTDCHRIEAAMTALVRATLQEAARAVCRRCTTEFPERDDQSCDYWHPPAPHGSILCDASGIHDLIAALDKEGS